MKLIREIDACDFEDDSWECEYFWERLHEQNLERDFNSYVEDMFPEGIDETDFNDWIRFDGDSILEDLGYKLEDNEE